MSVRKECFPLRGLRFSVQRNVLKHFRFEICLSETLTYETFFFLDHCLKKLHINESHTTFSLLSLFVVEASRASEGSQILSRALITKQKANYD